MPLSGSEVAGTPHPSVYNHVSHESENGETAGAESSRV